MNDLVYLLIFYLFFKKKWKKDSQRVGEETLKHMFGRFTSAHLGVVFRHLVFILYNVLFLVLIVI